ncbi:hypothetical protein [Chitinophaga pinensis]|uniref:hypothetical protein n=1 Tax=Chitinophaga pinensis TaxID=79329 RepID=UPI001C9A02A7|nr:hypothetical protein [Chitinophaga pinensis]
MKRICSSSNETLLGLDTGEDCLAKPVQYAEYTIVFVEEGEGIFHADFGAFPFKGPVLLFSTPLQMIYIEQPKPCKLAMLQFHSDFYCIEYHKAQVACNGLLFNNIYIEPSVQLNEREARIFRNLLEELAEEFDVSGCDEIVMRAIYSCSSRNRVVLKPDLPPISQIPENGMNRWKNSGVCWTNIT